MHVSRPMMVCETCVLQNLLKRCDSDGFSVDTTAYADLWALYITAGITLCQNMTIAQASVSQRGSCTLNRF